jgi:hypothetical protein
MAKTTDAMTDAEIRARILRLAFWNDESLFEKFRESLQTGLPAGTGVALRGSVVTDERYKDSRPFDADGEGTSDLDVTLIGNTVMELWESDEFYIPKLHTMVRRPVNFQATANFVLFMRDVLFDQPYYTLIEPSESK